MKLYLKLGIGVALLFAVAMIAVPFLIIAGIFSNPPGPDKILALGLSSLKSEDPKERVAGVDLLLGMGEEGIEALAGELDGGNKEAEFLAKHWPNYNEPVRDDKYERYPMHFAAENGWIDVVALFLSKGAEVDARANYGATPLHWAIFSGHKGIIAMLIEQGADVNAKSDEGCTMLQSAASKGDKETTVLLIEKGADVNTRGMDTQTPLHAAAGSGHTEVVKVLIRNGAVVNARDDWNITPLYWATCGGHSETIIYLLECGAKPTARDSSGRTPQDRATEKINHLTMIGAPDEDLEKAKKLRLSIKILRLWQQGWRDEKLKQLLHSHGAKTGEELREEAGE